MRPTAALRIFGPIVLAIAAVGLVVVNLPHDTPPPTRKAVTDGVRSVIFVNGDGMAAAHREAGRLFHAGFDGQLVMDQLPFSGQLTTSPRDPASAVTDSAAGAAAWATGQRTYNGAISVDVDRKPLPTLGAQAKAAGKATGLVTTAQVTDASPAAFFASTPERGAQDEIARQYLEVSRPDVILGGGEDWWLPAGTPGAYPDRPAVDPDEQSRGKKGNLVERAKKAGYRYVSNGADLDRAGDGKLLGLFGNEELFQQRGEGLGDAYEPPVSLAAMTGKALDVLGRGDSGFFLFVEEEGIDEFAHHNNGTRVLQAVAALDAAVAVARRYVAEHPDTLLVVTGDHECGGLTIGSPGDGPFPVKGSGLTFTMGWSTDQHTGVDVPVTAEGPQAQRFTGKHPNTFVHDVLAPLLT
ncbi:hypothetical protein Val02_71150 [Virgisporangium aliadipatigenens]|uniref:Alkaline phosphatase n=1 Tax=Virgisporangium aliadipatigenens TaxID=741659 RepID=A0A8J4DTY2_9ACTN|nr:alkaline phosphatase [Virgisporangium aliadipatigenens]GIJ50229.1 hypothetical protein Val02_71150 [Virgisporangium aliadipatigenens]